MLATFPPTNTPPPTTGIRGSWPLANFPLLRPKPRNPGQSPLRQPPIDNGEIYPERMGPTPSPQTPEKQGIFGTLFSKFDRNDRTPTGPLFPTPEPYRKARRRRCCGLSMWTILIVTLLVAIIIAAAVAVPILLLRQRKSQSTGLTVQQCETQQPCQNNGASILVNNPPQCACLCAAGFSGSTCQILDNSCATISSIKGGPTNTSIGSAIGPLIQIAQADFSNQFNLSSQLIVEQFAADNVSCTSQNSLVNLNGSTSADIPTINAINKVVVLKFWATTTIITTITETFTSTVPFVITSASTSWTSFGAAPTVNIMTSQMQMSTLLTSTSTVSSVPTATVQPSNGLSEQSLVFGRCVILAVVQDLGINSAAGLQQLLETAIEEGKSIVQDTSSGITVDLSALTISGLPRNG